MSDGLLALDARRMSGVTSSEIDAHLNDLASGNAEIEPLEIGARNTGRLRLRHVQCQIAPRRSALHHDSSRFHVNLIF